MNVLGAVGRIKVFFLTKASKLFHMFKGQSAIEYLMTYGWMLLVVAVVGGLIFTLASNQSLHEVSGFEGQQVVVENFGVSNSNQLSLQILNARRGTAEITNVTVEGSDGLKYNDSGFGGDDPNILELGSQDRAEVTVDGFNETESGESFDVEVTFNRDSLSGLVSQGRITGMLTMLDE